MGCMLGAVGPQNTDFFSILGVAILFYANQVVHPKIFRGNIIFLKGDNLRNILIPIL